MEVANREVPIIHIEVLTNMLNKEDVSMDNILLVLSSIPQNAELSDIIHQIDRSIHDVIKKLVDEDDKSQYNRLLSTMIYYIYALDQTDADNESVDRFTESFNLFLSFLVDYPHLVMTTINYLNKTKSLKSNSYLGIKLVTIVQRLTHVEFFHEKVSSTIFINIEDNHPNESLKKIKELLTIFASLVIFAVRHKEEKERGEIEKISNLVQSNIIQLIQHPVTETHGQVVSKCFSLNKNELVKRINSLYTYIIDTYQFLQMELHSFNNLHTDILVLLKTIIEGKTEIYTHFSNCNIIKILLDYFERTIEKSKVFEWLKIQPSFQPLIESLLWSKDSEDIKFGFHFIQQTLILINDKDLRKLWSDCVNLLSTLDSYGKHLIEPQWEGIVSLLLAYLSKQDDQERHNMDLFWMFKVLVTKALQHENPTVIKFILHNIFAQELNLNVYHDMVFEAILPYLDNGKLYDDVGLEVDVHPKLASSIKLFFSKAAIAYPQVFSTHFELIARKVHAVESFNAKSTVWHIYGAIYAAGIKCDHFDNDLLDQMVTKVIQVAQNFPPYRKTLFTEDFTSFFGCLQLDLDKWKIISKYFLANSLQEVYFHHTHTYLRNQHLTILQKNSTFFESILTQLHDFSKNLIQNLVKFDPQTHIILWHIKLFYEQGVDKSEEFENFFSGSITPSLTHSIQQSIDEIKVMNNNPYVQYEAYNNLAITNALTIYDCLPRFSSVLAEPNNLQSVIEGVVNCSEQNYELTEQIEELMYVIRKDYLDKSNAAHLELIKKSVIKVSERLRVFLGEDYVKGDEIEERTKSYKAEVFLIVINSCLCWVAEKEVLLEITEIEILNILYESLRSRKAGVRIQPIYRTTFDLLFEYLHREKLVDQAKMKDYIEDSSHLSIVKKHNRLALNRIFTDLLLPRFKLNDPEVEKFFKRTMNSISKNRNSFSSYYIFESLLVVAFEKLDKETATFMAEKLIEVCEIENSAFRLRKAAILVCRMILSAPKKIENYINLVQYLLIKEEARPRDASLVIDIREFVYTHGMFEELAEEMAGLNAHNGFPRILVCACLERLISRAHTYDEETQESVDMFISKLFSNLLFGHFREGNNRNMKPFEDKHKVLIRKIQCLVVLSGYLRKSKRTQAMALKKKLADSFEMIIEFYIQPTVRHYIEMLFVNTFMEEDSFCEVLISFLQHQETARIQPLMTVQYIASYFLLYKEFSNPSHRLTLSRLLSLNIGNNTSFSRYLSQYVLCRLLEEGKIDKKDPDIAVCMKIMDRNRENMVLVSLFKDIIAKYHYTIANLSLLTMLKTRFFNEKQEIVHGYVCDQFKEVSIQSTITQMDDSTAIKPEEAVHDALKSIFKEIEQIEMDEVDATFQRKIDNVLSIFPVGEGPVKREGEIVVVASLLDKLPNLANLTRTCEVFGVKELVIPSKTILKDPAFLNVTVTAEKWMPFVECAPENLARLLMMYRENNYKVGRM